MLKLRPFFSAFLLFAASVAAHAERMILVPVDSRPAAGQFAQMIAKIADVQVIQPPYDDLGRYTTPGTPDAILAWLEKQDYNDVSAVIVSTDMIAYGGLIESRINTTTYETALKRLQRLAALRERLPEVKFYGFSAIMRLFPTFTKESAPYATYLGRYEELLYKYRIFGSADMLKEIEALRAKLAPPLIASYEAARLRDEEVQEACLRLTKKGLFDYFILGQDDAKPYGPFIPETAHLQLVVDKLGIAGKIYFCEGIDQHSNVLVSRALLKETDWVPRVRVVYSDPSGKTKVAAYEAKDIEQSIRDQIFASGARPTFDNDYDYTLYVNTPGRAESEFRSFLNDLNEESDKGDPVCVADIDLGKDGTADPELFNSLLENGRMIKLLSYSGWNTAGNTLGTSIPAANVYLYSKKAGRPALEREIAQREFLLHRFVNDYAYHKFTRPMAYKLIAGLAGANKEEAYGNNFKVLNNFVRRDLTKHLNETFNEEFLGKRFSADRKQYEVTGLDAVKIFLPWPRVYEVRLEFHMEAREVPASN